VIANDDPCLVLEIDYLVEVLSVLFKASMLKSHILKKTSVNAGIAVNAGKGEAAIPSAENLE
jgi:hypothetical protein